MLGDNLVERSIAPAVRAFAAQTSGAHVLLKEVDDPERFGVARFESGESGGAPATRAMTSPPPPVAGGGAEALRGGGGAFPLRARRTEGGNEQGPPQSRKASTAPPGGERASDAQCLCGGARIVEIVEKPKRPAEPVRGDGASTSMTRTCSGCATSLSAERSRRTRDHRRQQHVRRARRSHALDPRRVVGRRRDIREPAPGGVPGGGGRGESCGIGRCCCSPASCFSCGLVSRYSMMP